MPLPPHDNQLNLYKRICCLLVLLFSFHLCYCQGTAIDAEYEAKLRKLSIIPIDSFWKYQPGDNPSYALPSYSDAHWFRATSTYLTDPAGKSLPWKGIGWFRQQLVVPDSLRGKQLAMLMGQFGASEFYMDGKLLYRFGIVGLSAATEKIYIPRKLVLLPLDSGTTHLIAIRYSSFFPNQAQAISFVQFPGFHLALAPIAQAFQMVDEGFPYRVVSVSFMIGFFLFFFCVYLFYPRRISSLMAAIQLADFAVIFITILIVKATTSGKVLVNNLYIWRICVANFACFGLLFLYSAYYGKLIKRAWLIVAAMLFLTADTFYSSYTLWAAPVSSVISFLALLILFESYRILFLGIKNRKSGFWILTFGWVMTQLGGYLVIFNKADLFPPYATTLASVLSVITDLFTPLTYALYLAWEFGSANKDLRLQLAQVRTLSEKTLLQEQEKQQILATQKETLERQVAERTELVVAQKKEIEDQRDHLEETLQELKATQAQLIQREKMASLGELTAGIAHEIQNPLNFVNNFSEVSVELINEAKEEMIAGKKTEALGVLEETVENLQKIIHHGKRADAIVKGMLQHSRASTGKKELTDLNALVEEYLRLSYQAIRSKDKSFTAVLETHFNNSIGRINVVPQDIGRVLLNLFNNAFYTLQQKKQQLNDSFEPKVSVSTKKVNNKVEIIVKDNGNGISQSIKDKIFQPFFTTKPTGQGTGLGLSLSYDIIQAHGGTLRVESREGEYTEFIIYLPI